MALDQQQNNIIDGLIHNFDAMYAAADHLRSLQQGATDSGLGQPVDQDLIDAGFDWFTGAQIVSAFQQITTILATLNDDTVRGAVNRIRRFP